MRNLQGEKRAVRLRSFTNTRSSASIMVDAAIALPLFIIAIAMILQVINIVAKEETAYYNAETQIQLLGNARGSAAVGRTVDDANRKVYIEHVQYYPIFKNVKFPFPGALFKNVILSMDMPYRTYIGESPDKYENNSFVYIFPKNEGSEKETPKYHTVYCQTMKAGATKGLNIEKVSKEEAINRGYALCKHCSAKSKGLKNSK